MGLFIREVPTIGARSVQHVPMLVSYLVVVGLSPAQRERSERLRIFERVTTDPAS